MGDYDRFIAEAAHESIITIDEHALVVAWNPAAEKMFGFSAQEMMGKTLDAIVPPGLRRAHHKAIKRVFDTGKLHLKGQPVELTGTRRDGSKFPLEISMTLWQTDGRRFVTAIIRDTTTRKQVEEQLRQSQKMASLGIMASGVAHEINNPSNAIMLNVGALEEIWAHVSPIIEQYCRENRDFTVKGVGLEEIKQKIPAMFAGIKGAANRIKSINRNLGDFARSEPLCLKRGIDANEIAKSAASLVHSLVAKATNHFALRCEQNLPKIKGDFQKLEQVVVNLVQNAAQALKNKSDKVTLSTAFDRKRKSVEIIVEDEGVGISQEDLEHIMDPFFTTKRGSGGIGLGLAIASSIVRDHGGTLEFASTLGKGTTAKVVIPIQGK